MEFRFICVKAKTKTKTTPRIEMEENQLKSITKESELAFGIVKKRRLC